MRQKQSVGADTQSRYRGTMASENRITAAQDASMISQAQEQIVQRGDELDDAAVAERALNAFLLRRAIENTQSAAGLDEAAAEQTAHDELAAMRCERRGAA